MIVFFYFDHLQTALAANDPLLLVDVILSKACFLFSKVIIPFPNASLWLIAS